MNYFGGGGVQGRLHPSLRTFIDCFMSSPLPKMYPRGGGPHDQDPTLMRHFREILKIKGQCEEMQEAQREMAERAGGNPGIGGGSGLDISLDRLIEEHDY